MMVREEVEKYILELTNNSTLDHSRNLFESNLLSSLDTLDLISFIEETFNISLSDDDVSMENLGSINNIVYLVEKLKQKE